MTENQIIFLDVHLCSSVTVGWREGGRRRRMRRRRRRRNKNSEPNRL